MTAVMLSLPVQFAGFGKYVDMDTSPRLGKYVSRRRLGAGSFATVWLADDPVLEAPVAIKVLADNWSQHLDVRRRFVEEARLLRRIDHDRVVRVHDIDELPDGRPFFVMTWADRGTLEERMKTLTAAHQRFDVADAVALASEICECLAVVHDFGIVHRDVKPSNVLFRTIRPHERRIAERHGGVLGAEHVILGDFGLAKDLAASSGLTQAAGTPAYMAPEQAYGVSIVDIRADVFGVASVLYEMLTGRPPVSASTLSGVRRDRDGTAVIPLRALRPDVSPALAAAVGRGLAFDPSQRYDSALSFAAALAEAGTVAPGIPALSSPIVRVRAVVESLRVAPSADVLVSLEACLVAPFQVKILDPDLLPLPADAVDDGTFPIDVLVAFSDSALADVRARLATVGPLLMLVVTDEPAPLASELGAVVVPDSDVGRTEASRRIEDVRQHLPLARSASALALLAAHVDLADIEEALRNDFPELAEMELLRRDSAMGSPLPRPLRAGVRDLFLGVTAAAKLGVPTAGTSDLRAEAERQLDRWRALSTSGRIPFAALTHAITVERALERIWTSPT